MSPSASSHNRPFQAPPLGEPYLLTPGPLTTAFEVKQAMLRDWGSWDSDFRAMTKSLCDQLVALAGDTRGEFVCVPMQGSGTYCVEALLGTFIPRDGKVLVLANGAYGLRAAETMRYLGRAYSLIDKGDYMPPRGAEVGAALDADPAISHVIAIHCETSSGILNPVAAFLEALRIHAAEGGVAARGARYTRNRDVMVAGMRDLGFETLLKDRWLSPIIVTFFNPAHPNFEFARFYDLMKQRGFIIYPGKLTVVDSFRIGCIGRMDEHVMSRVVAAAGEALAEMGVDDAAPPASAIAERAKLAA